jgi:hypothetical protein
VAGWIGSGGDGDWKMSEREYELMARVKKLEARLRAIVLVTFVIAAWVVLDRATSAGASEGDPAEIVASKITIVDEQGRRRLLLGGEYEKGRVSKAAGIFLFDDTGAERGGMITMEDGSAVIALDAPAGVGSPMRDRLGLKVYKNGAASISLINNQTGIPVRLISDANGTGGVEFLDYDLTARKAFLKRIDYNGETKSEQSLD